MRNHARFRSVSGFTLLELLVVIAIIGILSSIAVVSFNSARSKARDSKRIADSRAVLTALTLYYDDHEYYPSAAPAVDAPLEDGATKYMQKWPKAPSQGVAYNYGSNPPACDNSTTTCSSFTFHFTLENPNKDIGATSSNTLCSATPDGVHCP